MSKNWKKSLRFNLNCSNKLFCRTSASHVARFPHCVRAGGGSRAPGRAAVRQDPAGHALSPPTISRPFRRTERGCQGTAAGTDERCNEGEHRGVLFGIFPSCQVFSRVTHRIRGVRPPLSARGGLGAPGLVRTGGLGGRPHFDCYSRRHCSSGGGFPSFATNIFPFPVVSAQGGIRDVFFILILQTGPLRMRILKSFDIFFLQIFLRNFIFLFA